MFVDEAEISVEGGHGGDGCLSFRREKYVPRGGPDGGDGGRGGSVVLVADPNLNTLLEFRHRQRFRGDRGGGGQGKNMHGRGGDDCVVRVPVGTIVTDVSGGDTLADLVRAGQRVVVARGGRGGRGNTRFKSSTNRTPRRVESGSPGEQRRLKLTLKLIADVGLVGLPNAGKSSLLSAISQARPKIADYPFTTLEPVLGIVPVRDYQHLVVADIPGIIEGAHQGRGLGHQFLRHIERTRLLAFLIDITSADRAATYRTLCFEIGAFSATLLAKPRLIVYTKSDLLPEGSAPPPSPGDGVEVCIVSAVAGMGLRKLVDTLYDRVLQLERRDPQEEEITGERELNG